MPFGKIVVYSFLLFFVQVFVSTLLGLFVDVDDVDSLGLLLSVFVRYFPIGIVTVFVFMFFPRGRVSHPFIGGLAVAGLSAFWSLIVMIVLLGELYSPVVVISDFLILLVEMFVGVYIGLKIFKNKLNGSEHRGRQG